MKLDKYNLKILHELEKDVQCSFTTIAKSVRLSPQVVRYRITRMEKQLIERYVIVLNMHLLGFEAYKWYLELGTADQSVHKEMIRSLCDNPWVSWVAETTGRWGMAAVFFAHNAHDFEEKKKSFLLSFGKYIRRQATNIDLGVHHVKSKNERTPFYGREGTSVELDKTDIRILWEMTSDPRQNTLEIARKTGLTPDIIRYRKKKLHGSGLIEGSQLVLSQQESGKQLFKLLCNLSPGAETKHFISTLSSYPSVTGIVECIGNWSCEINLEVQNSRAVHSITTDFKSRFPSHIQDYELLQIYKEHKFDFFPMGKALLSS